MIILSHRDLKNRCFLLLQTLNKYNTCMNCCLPVNKQSWFFPRLVFYWSGLLEAYEVIWISSI